MQAAKKAAEHTQTVMIEKFSKKLAEAQKQASDANYNAASLETSALLTVPGGTTWHSGGSGGGVGMGGGTGSAATPEALAVKPSNAG